MSLVTLVHMDSDAANRVVVPKMNSVTDTADTVSTVKTVFMAFVVTNLVQNLFQAAENVTDIHQHAPSATLASGERTAIIQHRVSGSSETPIAVVSVKEAFGVKIARKNVTKTAAREVVT